MVRVTLVRTTDDHNNHRVSVVACPACGSPIGYSRGELEIPVARLTDDHARWTYVELSVCEKPNSVSEETRSTTVRQREHESVSALRYVRLHSGQW